MLGARVHAGGVPSGALVARVERTVELFREGRAPIILFSGGVGAHPPAEAEVACALAVSRGVPRGACVLETESRNTAENARRCLPILRTHGVERVWLVTDPFHCFRSRQHFWRLGIDAHPVATRWEERGRTRFELVRWWLRELPAFVRDPGLLLARRPAPPR